MNLYSLHDGESQDSHTTHGSKSPQIMPMTIELVMTVLK